jgi:hypothetical protein
MTEVIDFARSFLWWRNDLLDKPPLTQTSKPPFTLNNARVPLDCLCRIEDKTSDAVEFFALGASCKTERVGVERDIWMEPNADFIPVMSGTRFLALKTYHRAGIELPLEPPSLGYQPERQEVAIAEAFASARFDVRHAEGRLLENAKERVEAVLANEILVARTAYQDERYRVLIEYPIKTVNANERDWVFQPDTGPILLPDLNRAPPDLLGGMELAYIAFNQADWAEVVVRLPTSVAPGVNVYHYSQAARIACVNEVISLGR